MSPLISIDFLQRQSDERLVALAGAGNERAFETLVKRYRRPLMAYALRLLRNEARAEDVVQQALLQAWIALQSSAQPGALRPWLFRIIHNAAVTSIRRHHVPCVQLDEALDTAELADGAEARIACCEALSGLAALPDLQRRAMVLTAFGGSSHGEVAATLGLSDGAVRGLIYRARASLRSAAAAILPLPVTGWFAGRGLRRGPVAERAAEVLAGAGSAGAGGVMLKAGAIAATAGALATATQILVPPVTPFHYRPHFAIATVRHVQGRDVIEARGALAGGARAAYTVTTELSLPAARLPAQQSAAAASPARHPSAGNAGGHQGNRPARGQSGTHDGAPGPSGHDGGGGAATSGRGSGPGGGGSDSSGGGSDSSASGSGSGGNDGGDSGTDGGSGSSGGPAASSQSGATSTPTGTIATAPSTPGTTVTQTRGGGQDATDGGGDGGDGTSGGGSVSSGSGGGT